MVLVVCSSSPSRASGSGAQLAASQAALLVMHGVPSPISLEDSNCSLVKFVDPFVTYLKYIHALNCVCVHNVREIHRLC